MSLMRDILDAAVGAGELLICFLGQNGFIFRVPGLCFGVDLYLSDSCAEDEEITSVLGVRLDRLLPVFIRPSELELDLILATHEHKDHADPETLCGVQACKTTFAGPPPVMKLFSELGFAAGRCLELSEGQSRTFGPVTIQPVFARHVAGSVGYLFEAGGLKIYMTGDTEFDERLCAVARFSPDIMLVCINGRWGNMSSEEAAELTRRIGPKVVVPVHYDMFAANSADANAFAGGVSSNNSGARPLVLEAGRLYRFSRATL